MGSFRRFCRRVAAKMLPDTTPDSHPLARRQPLGDVTTAANNAATPTTNTNTTTTGPTTPAVAAAIAAFRSAAPAAVPQGKKKSSRAGAPPTTAAPATTAPTTAVPHTTTHHRALRTLSTALHLRRKTSVGPWKLGRTLGKGANGKVKEARHAGTGEMAAVKIVKKVGGEVPGSVAREVAVMAVLGGLGEEEEEVGRRGRGLVGLKDVFENGREVYLLLTHHPHGDLHTHLTTHGPLPTHHALTLLHQLLTALSHLHAHHLSHRDLKPENILLSYPPGADPTTIPTLSIADFGLATLSPPNTLHTTRCGSPHYVAPEIALGRAYSGPCVDAWACGVVFFAMVTGTLPFPGRGTERTLGRIAEGRWRLPSGMRVSGTCERLLAGLLTWEPAERMSVGEALAVLRGRGYGVEVEVEEMEETGDEEGEGGYDDDGDEGWENGGDDENDDEYESAIEYQNDDESASQTPPPSPSHTAIHTAIHHTVTIPHPIDPNLLRTLGSIWSWLDESDLRARLMSHKPNNEQRFYAAMCRFRARADERYGGWWRGR